MSEGAEGLQENVLILERAWSTSALDGPQNHRPSYPRCRTPWHQRSPLLPALAPPTIMAPHVRKTRVVYIERENKRIERSFTPVALRGIRGPRLKYARTDT